MLDKKKKTDEWRNGEMRIEEFSAMFDDKILHDSWKFAHKKILKF